jgi:uncharacterized protein (DUF305 family)
MSKWLAGLVLALVLGLLIGLTAAARAVPGEHAAETGFARDMIVHHAQAVEMAVLLYDRTEDSTLRTIALDIMLGQQGQIGQMQGWLQRWGRSQAGIDLPMAWMDMPVSGLMMGMADDAAMTALRDSTGVEADRQFITLMIPHHQAGIHMAQAVIARTDDAGVRQFAASIIATQTREIAELTALLDALPHF